MSSLSKPFAALSSGLLARKGAARPAMRPQAYGQLGSGVDDLGWDDMGFEAPRAVAALRDDQHDAFGEELSTLPQRSNIAALTPVSPVHSQCSEIISRLKRDEQTDSAAPAVRLPRASFTLRIEPQRHLRLRLASAVSGRSSQQLVTEAVDRMLSQMPEIDSIAGQLLEPKARRTARRTKGHSA